MRAARVAANVSCSVCCESPLAQRRALYLVKNPWSSNLYLKTQVVGIEVFSAFEALLYGTSVHVFLSSRA